MSRGTACKRDFDWELPVWARIHRWASFCWPHTVQIKELFWRIGNLGIFLLCPRRSFKHLIWSHPVRPVRLNPAERRGFIGCRLNKIVNKTSYMVAVTKEIISGRMLTCHDPLSLWVMSPLLELSGDISHTNGPPASSGLACRVSSDPDPITNTLTCLTSLRTCCHLVPLCALICWPFTEATLLHH